MTTTTKIARRKLSLLDLAHELGIVSKACKIMGNSRQQVPATYIVICSLKHSNARPCEPDVVLASQSAVTLRGLFGDGSPSEALCVTGKRDVGNCGVYASISNCGFSADSRAFTTEGYEDLEERGKCLQRRPGAAWGRRNRFSSAHPPNRSPSSSKSK